MADVVMFIVQRLSEEPFAKKLTLVDFDELSPLDLTQVLTDVFAEIDPKLAADVRDTARDQHAAKMMTTLTILKFNVPRNEDQREAFQRGLAAGDKAVVYPVMHWLLDRLKMHKKRAYVARFLLPIDVPPEYLQDEMLADSYQHLKSLQGEFKQAHMAVEEARKQPVHSTELNAELVTLEEEKRQLVTKIEKLKKQNAEVHDFDLLLKATNNLRLQQDEDARLADNMRKQRMALQQAEQRKKEAVKRLNNLRSSNNASDAHGLLDQIAHDVEVLERRVQADLPRETDAKRERLQRLHESRMEPHRTHDDVEEVKRGIRQDEARIEDLKKRIAEAVQDRNDSKLANFRQHATMVAKKLKDKEDEIEKLELEEQRISREIEQREMTMTDVGGAKFMTREEFKKFGAKLREKTHVYKKQKAELAELRAESVVLHRTEQILRSRVENLDAFLSELEAKKGVRGYRDTQEKLEKASEQTAEVDALKEKTLAEISSMVRDITEELKKRKKELNPQISRLKDVRAAFQQVEGEYNIKKANYDKVAVGLDVERQQLEAECDTFQQEALEEESRFHYLNCLTAMAEATLKRIDDETTWKEGKGRGLLPNFKCYEDLYNNKLTQQQAFSEQLRKQRAQLEKHEGPSMKQRLIYTDVEKLLACKHNLTTAGDITQIGFASTEYDMGNARVATFA